MGVSFGRMHCSDGSFLSKYGMEEKIGEGAYGVVYACKPKKKKSTTLLAVKLLEKTESNTEDVRLEITILKRVAGHVNCMTLVDVLEDEFFTYAVMVKYAGGDLVDGIETQLEKNGIIHDKEVTHIVRQMASAILHLHTLCIIHRDVKGDNFVLDRRNIIDAHCTVALTDFGTATELMPGETLSIPSGTSLFWSPEVINKSYGHKSDVWALGIIFFGIIDGTFPFRGLTSIKKSPLRKVNCSEEANELLRALLTKDPDERPNSAGVFTFAFLSRKRSAIETATMRDFGRASAVNVSGLREHVPEHTARRLNDLKELAETEFELARKRNTISLAPGLLGSRNISSFRSSIVDAKLAPLGIGQNSLRVSRMMRSQNFSTFGISSGFIAEPFTSTNSSDVESSWEWFALHSKALESVEGAIPQAGHGIADKEVVRIFTPETIKTLLEKHNVDTSVFGGGKAKTLADLAKECIRGESQLLKDSDNELRRVVNVVVLQLSTVCMRNGVASNDIVAGTDPVVDVRIRESSTSVIYNDAYLVEVTQVFPNGRRTRVDRLLGTKMRPDESPGTATRRIFEDELGCKPWWFSLGSQQEFEEEARSASYPSIRTLYRKTLINVTLSTDVPLDELANIGLPKGDDFKTTHDGISSYYEWWSQERCLAHKLQLFGHTTPHPTIPEAGWQHLFHATLSYSVSMVADMLTQYGIDVANFGVGEAKSLESIAFELSMCESQLLEDPDVNGRLLRVIDVVIVRLTAPNGKLLIEVSQKVANDPSRFVMRLPGSKQRTNENVFVCARRLLRQIRENKSSWDDLIDLSLGANELLQDENESASYPGLTTLYRKHIVVARPRMPAIDPSILASATSVRPSSFGSGSTWVASARNSLAMIPIKSSSFWSRRSTRIPKRNDQDQKVWPITEDTNQ